MKILIKGKVEAVDPAHFECEPETGTATKRKTQSKMTNSKATKIVCRTRKDQVRSSSTLTQKSDRTGVKLTKNTQTQSAATIIGKSSATTPQHQAHRVNLPRPLTPYVALHSRTRPFLALAGATAVCERIHVYPYGVKTPDITDTLKIPDVRNNPHIADSDKSIEKSILPHDLCRWSTP